ncbi:MAG: LysE family transporter, partial [Chloroflexota bacterium]
LCVVTGLAAILLADPIVRTILLWASVAYLVYLAIRIALAGSNIAFSPAKKEPGIVDGVALQFLNPKAYVVNTTLFTGFPLFPNAFGAEIAVKFLIVNVIWIAVHTIWLWAGVSLHRLEFKPRVQSAINIAMALAMLAVVALAALQAT